MKHDVIVIERYYNSRCLALPNNFRYDNIKICFPYLRLVLVYFSIHFSLMKCILSGIYILRLVHENFLTQYTFRLVYIDICFLPFPVKKTITIYSIIKQCVKNKRICMASWSWAKKSAQENKIIHNLENVLAFKSNIQE